MNNLPVGSRAKINLAAAVSSVYFHDNLCLAINDDVEALQTLSTVFNTFILLWNDSTVTIVYTHLTVYAKYFRLITIGPAKLAPLPRSHHLWRRQTAMQNMRSRLFWAPSTPCAMGLENKRRGHVSFSKNSRNRFVLWHCSDLTLPRHSFS